MSILGDAPIRDEYTSDPSRAAPLLIVTHVAIRTGARGLQIDDQTAAEILQWLRHFERITYLGVADAQETQSSSTKWVDVEADPAFARCTIIALPRAYRPLAMLRHLGAVRATLRRLIPEHEHLSFTIGGLFGDWPAIASIEAARQERSYANKVDRVESQVLAEKSARQGGLSRRLANTIYLPLIEHYTRYNLRRSKISLLQGLDVFNHYRSFCKEPYCTYNTHTHVADRISAEALVAKQARILAGQPLRLVYVGRAAPMKGPGDWLDALDLLQGRQIPFEATWIGDGPDIGMMRERVAASSMAGEVHFPGFEDDREVLLQALRDSDMLLFCHKTLESPRCLIEALVAGCPLVGYGTDYSRGLVSAHGGGEFVAMHDVSGLAKRITDLHADRHGLASLVHDAARSGQDYNEDAIYAYRAGLMQKA